MVITPMFRMSASLAALALATPALAHPGPHEGLSLAAILDHFATPFHLLPGAALMLSGVGYLVLKRWRLSRDRPVARRGKDHA